MHQKELRADLYQGLADAVFQGEHTASATGKRIILPASFTGGARYMIQNYQDAMAICRWAEYPDLFLTFTCNSSWPEIDRFVKKYNVKANNRPEVLSRVFRMKLLRLMKVLKEDKIFGEVRAEVYTIEFQKRGYPHAHILLFLEDHDKIKTVERVDQFISAEIPDEVTKPHLHKLVKNFMIHGPCGSNFPNSPCMLKKKECNKRFPKKFCQATEIDDEGFPTYRRSNNGMTVKIKEGVFVDNRFVVPYNATLLQLFEAHINIEKCNQSMAIKYLFKYISKGHDRVVAGIFGGQNAGQKNVLKDEIQQYYNCRYISACEGSWRLLGFDIHHRKPSVERLSFHLRNQQYVIYNCNDDVADLVDKIKWFTKWLLDLGDGKLGVSEDGIADIEIPEEFLVPYSENPVEAIVEATYPDLLANLTNNMYFNERAILAPTIKMVGQINSYMCSLLPGEEFQFLSCDSVCRSSEDNDTVDSLYTSEFLNTIESSGLPSHTLTLKIDAPVILLRNIDQSAGLCNGTRLRITRISKNVLEAITLNGSHPNEKVLIHRMNLNPSETRLPFKMRRRQFPINLSFAMTINKSQGQSLKHVCVYLEKPVFTYGQLYVACSRVRSVDGLKIYIPTSSGSFECTTKNVVYDEVLRKIYNVK